MHSIKIPWKEINAWFVIQGNTVCTYIHTCMHSYIHTYIHTYLHIYTHTYTYHSLANFHMQINFIQLIWYENIFTKKFIHNLAQNHHQSLWFNSRVLGSEVLMCQGTYLAIIILCAFAVV